MNKRNSEQDDESFIVPPFQLIAKPKNVEYLANINKAFIHSEQFDEIVYAMENASAGDTFTLNLTTPGGSLQAVIPLLNAMDNTAADVHVHVASDVASAGTMILMKAHTMSINDYVTIMFHQVSFGAGGNGWNVECQVNHVQKSSKALCREIYKHFLTDAEMEKMLTGTEWYMGKEEFIERYQKRSELLTKEIEGMIAELEAAEKAATKAPRKKKPLNLVVDTAQ